MFGKLFGISDLWTTFFFSVKDKWKYLSHGGYCEARISIEACRYGEFRTPDLFLSFDRTVCYMICFRTPGQRFSWKVCSIHLVHLLFHWFICSFPWCWPLIVRPRPGLGIHTSPALASKGEILTTNDNYTLVWISTRLGEVHNALETSGKSVNLAGRGSRKAETPKDEKKRARWRWEREHRMMPNGQGGGDNVASVDILVCLPHHVWGNYRDRYRAMERTQASWARDCLSIGVLSLRGWHYECCHHQRCGARTLLTFRIRTWTPFPHRNRMLNGGCK